MVPKRRPGYVVAIITAAMGLTFGAVEAQANAEGVIPSHTGSITSNPPGTGEVPVTLTCEAAVVDVPPGESCTKIWTDLPSQPHEIEWGVAQGTLLEEIINDTGIPWTDYHWELIGQGEVEGFAISLNTEVDGTFEVTLIPDPSDPVGAAFTVFFNEPFTPGPGDFLVSIEFAFAGVDTVLIRQYPTVPLPASLGLLGFGLVVLRKMSSRMRQSASEICESWS